MAQRLLPQRPRRRDVPLPQQDVCPLHQRSDGTKGDPKSTHGEVLIDPDGFVFDVDAGGSYSATTGMYVPVQALAATQEAAALYRELARANPQAFLPDLAGSLNNLGAMLSALGRREEAQEAFAEGLRAIRPFAQAYPAAFGDLAAALEEYYLQARQNVDPKGLGDL